MPVMHSHVQEDSTHCGHRAERTRQSCRQGPHPGVLIVALCQAAILYVDGRSLLLLRDLVPSGALALDALQVLLGQLSVRLLAQCGYSRTGNHKASQLADQDSRGPPAMSSPGMTAAAQLESADRSRLQVSHMQVKREQPAHRCRPMTVAFTPVLPASVGLAGDTAARWHPVQPSMRPWQHRAAVGLHGLAALTVAVEAL